MEATALSGYETWIIKGNDEVVEREIMDGAIWKIKRTKVKEAGLIVIVQWSSSPVE